jgi:3-methyl-2-oxobutanoate hydroxymethyltransferase
MKTIIEFRQMKEKKIPISMITCYDYWSAKIIRDSDIDAVLVGDSAAMVMHGYETTVNADMVMMDLHVKAVKKGVKDKFLIADLPFLTHKRGFTALIDAVDKLMKSGANAVKIEGSEGHLQEIENLVKSGVPVMGHIGLTPQSVHKFGGFRVQGKSDVDAKKLLSQAKNLESAGCFAIVLELVPSDLAKEITESFSIPTIGIGAGKYTSGQVLVLHDLLGMDKDFSPKFLRRYFNGWDAIKNALNTYNTEVKENKFPSDQESY